MVITWRINHELEDVCFGSVKVVGGRRLLGERLFVAFVQILLWAVENLHILGNHLSLAADLPVFLPRAGLEFALNIYFHAFADIFLSPFSEVAPEDDGMPIGAVRHLYAVLHDIAAFGSSEIEICNGNAAVKIAHFGVGTYIANKNDFVYG